MLVNDILRKKESTLYTTTPDTPLLDAIHQLNEHNIGALLVLETGKLAGIISERDVLHAVGKKDGGLGKMQVRDIMTTDLITCDPFANLDKVMVLMTEKRIRHLPVLEKGKLTGLISIGDVVKGRLREIESEAQDLKDYIRGVR
ncbi:MAG TPA: CBS domain-containing protein [bacterium]|nr:CBS domain-containing protein [bacterium]